MYIINFYYSSKKYQSWNGGKVQHTYADKRDLKRARTDGRLAEALLDRREKMKADRYCK
jgi:protein FRG1